ncbi:AP-2 complex subunit sigma [Tulasnella sp. 417]|nr:AP-2 complex subunit sigma [Tulasnella sp. 417]
MDSRRVERLTSLPEVPEAFGEDGGHFDRYYDALADENDEDMFRNYKVVYRRYPGRFLCLCVDADDNELAYLEAIHLFVEVLFGEAAGPPDPASWPDSFFQNVCEMDLAFNLYKVYAILDEESPVGEIEEFLKEVVLNRLDQLENLE